MRYTLEIINEELTPHGWKCTSDEYHNLDNPMTFLCDEGHTVYTSWRKLRNKLICPICEKNKYKSVNHSATKKQPGVKRIIALDQSSRISGYAIFDGKILVDYGTFESTLEDEIKRGHQLKEWLISMVSLWNPDYIGIEGIQYQQQMGVTTFQTLARIQGILMDCCVELGLIYEICPTNTWRHHCGVKGRSRADKKKSMQHLIKKWYDVRVTEDEADAIGIGKYMAEAIVNRGEIVSWE